MMRRFFGLGGDGREYRANAVQFDGSNDYLTRGAELTGIADGKAGTLSVWLNFTGGDAANQHFLSNKQGKHQQSIKKENGGEVYELYLLFS